MSGLQLQAGGEHGEAGQDECDAGLRKRGEAEDLAVADGPEAAGEERCDDYSADLEDVQDHPVTGCYNQSQPTEHTIKQEADEEVNEAGLKGEGADECGGESVDGDEGPWLVFWPSGEDFFKLLGGFLDADAVVHHVFIYLVRVPQLAQVNALSCRTGFTSVVWIDESSNEMIMQSGMYRNWASISRMRADMFMYSSSR